MLFFFIFACLIVCQDVAYARVEGFDKKQLIGN